MIECSGERRGKIVRNTVPYNCFDHCKLHPDVKRAKSRLFASTFPVSEYMDNIGRVGRVIIDNDMHCHRKCGRAWCSHPYVVNLQQDPRMKKEPCIYRKTGCCGFKSTFKPANSSNEFERCMKRVKSHLGISWTC